MAYKLYINGEGVLQPDENTAKAEMHAFIKRHEEKGYRVAPHATDKDRYMLQHPTEGSADVYVEFE